MADTTMKMLVNAETGEERMVELSAAELAQRDLDQKADAAAAVIEQKQESDRAAMVAKLLAGTATAAEQQKTLATLLGGA